MTKTNQQGTPPLAERPVSGSGPTLGWDCHAHLLGPYQRFPLAAERSYTPPEATGEQYQALLAHLGLSHGVLVHPSAYGDNFDCLLHALATWPNLRGVLVARSDTQLNFKTLRGQGIRALRFSHRSGPGGNFVGSALFDELETLAPRLADAGLHAELWTDTPGLQQIEARLQRLPIPVVIDHMGGYDPQAGVHDAGFQTLLRLLSGGQIWLKLTAYRNALPSQDLTPLQPFHQAILQTNPNQLLWGTDWPHIRVTPTPDPGELLQTFRQWTPDPGQQRQILLENPTRLYG